MDAGEVDIDVHGGLNYSNFCDGSVEERFVYHVPEPGEPDNIWWFGFDCVHLYDYKPKPTKYQSLFEVEEGAYRDIDYVKWEIRNLAQQLKAIEDKNKGVSK